ncbi:MAG: preprotein translocase subunit SecE [Selenomonadaceae bacterium]
MAEEESSAVQKNNSQFNLKRFLGEVRAELKKVSWSDRKELISYTGIVFVAVVFVCALIWICDTVFARLLELILR